MINKIILVGNPNTGKTTLYNTLTNSQEKATNWHGVTVGVVSKKVNIKGRDFEIFDIPGIYSLDGFSNEEKIASNFLKSHKDYLIVNICDANNLQRNINLTNELIKSGYNVIIAVNMYQETTGIDYYQLQRILGCEVVKIDARNKRGIKDLEDKVLYKKMQKTNNFNKKYGDYGLFIKNLDYSNNYKTTDKIDSILLNKWLFLPLFLIIMFFVFYITFGWVGSSVSYIISLFFTKIINILQNLILCTNLNLILKYLLCDGLLNSFLTIISFIPQVAIMLFLLNFLEDVGYMSRVSFMLDGMLKKIGLTGKSLFSLCLGFGCTTSAVVTTRNLENENLRKRTALLLPFCSCSAKLPVFLVISSLFFEKYKVFFVFGLYLFSCLLSLLFACVYKKMIPLKKDLFILEMPKYRIPNFKKIFLDLWLVVKEFLIKTCTLLIFFSCFVWILQNFSIKLEFLNGTKFENSILYLLSEKLTIIFKPLGFVSVGIVCAIIFGLVAKEMVIAGLAIINGVGGSLVLLQESLINSNSICYFTDISAVVFLVFILLYTPCVSSLVSMKNEFGKKFAIYVFIFQFLLAYVISFIIYKFLIFKEFAFIVILLLILAILIRFMVKLICKNDFCRGNCCDCRKI